MQGIPQAVSISDFRLPLSAAGLKGLPLYRTVFSGVKNQKLRFVLRGSSKQGIPVFPEEWRRALFRGPISGEGSACPANSGPVVRGASNSDFHTQFPAEDEREHTCSLCGTLISGCKFPTEPALSNPEIEADFPGSRFRPSLRGGSRKTDSTQPFYF